MMLKIRMTIQPPLMVVLGVHKEEMKLIEVHKGIQMPMMMEII